MRDNESAVRVGTGISGTSRVVWLDVVRLVAMFTVVCCHCTDPFNFYPGRLRTSDGSSCGERCTWPS